MPTPRFYSALIAAFFMISTAHAQETPESAAEAKAALEAAAPVDVAIEFGNASAPVLIEEYASLSCSHCAAFHKEELPKITKSLLKTGKAKLLLHSYIRNEPDLRGTMLLSCLNDNTERQQYLDVMFNMQEQWAFNENVSGALADLVKVGGFDMNVFKSCLADKKLEMGLLKQLQMVGETRDIKGTPSFFINGERYTGAPVSEQLEKFISHLPAPTAAPATKATTKTPASSKKAQ